MKGTVLPATTYRTALRHRLGCMFLPEVDLCHCCKKNPLDVHCVHAGCCAKAEAARGHYAVARTLFQVAQTINPSITKEEIATGLDRLRLGNVVTGVVIVMIVIFRMKNEPDEK